MPRYTSKTVKFEPKHENQCGEKTATPGKNEKNEKKCTLKKRLKKAVFFSFFHEKNEKKNIVPTLYVATYCGIGILYRSTKDYEDTPGTYLKPY